MLGDVAQVATRLGPPVTLIVDADGTGVAKHIGPSERDSLEALGADVVAGHLMPTE